MFKIKSKWQLLTFLASYDIIQTKSNLKNKPKPFTMKKIIPFIALFSSEAMAQPTIISITAPAADVTHNSIVIFDQIDGNGQPVISFTEYGSTQALGQRTPNRNRPSGGSTDEVMLVNLTGPSVFFRKVYVTGTDTMRSGKFEVQLKTTPVLYLKVENLPAADITVGQNTASAKLKGIVKCNESIDVWFEWGTDQTMPFTTQFVTKPAGGIDTVAITVTGLPKNSTIYFRANAMANVSMVVVTASTIASFSTLVSGVSEIFLQNFKVYPNPVVDDYFFVKSPVKGKFEIFDVDGKILLAKEIGEKEEAVKVEGSPGVYFYRFKGEGIELSGGKILLLPR